MYARNQRYLLIMHMDTCTVVAVDVRHLFAIKDMDVALLSRGKSKSLGGQECSHADNF